MDGAETEGNPLKSENKMECGKKKRRNIDCGKHLWGITEDKRSILVLFVGVKVDTDNVSSVFAFCGKTSRQSAQTKEPGLRDRSNSKPEL